MDGYTELVPTQSYLFRHDRGVFWSGEVFLKYYGLPNIRFVRWLLKPIMTARAIYKAMLATDSADGAIVQDLVLPLETSEAFVEYVARELKIWPLWVCPIRKEAGAENIIEWPFYKPETKATAISSRVLKQKRVRGDLTLNFGVWGPIDPSPVAVQKTNRELEQKLRELRGMKVPYATNFYTEDEFWELYDHRKYNDLRKKWHAEALPTVYDEVRRKQSSQELGDAQEASLQHPLTWKDTILQI